MRALIEGDERTKKKNWKIYNKQARAQSQMAVKKQEEVRISYFARFTNSTEERKQSIEFVVLILRF